ncbi:hypothetical protein L873DRAFT_1805464 [Choiromyces venosus 120613-1]|uniref:Uncharacterized protein n=1 Tax=Choiromyces venosus 120613-1 TaxID=1336337 RepID=A0A3N4JPX3_9PEZI|nr:hypothetical protein L873DRAFT_1805464 [Choiromyces venosus 120613-1]
MGTVLNVVISALKEAKAVRKEARSPILGPVIPARTALHSEVGNVAWTRWVEENAEKASVTSLTLSPTIQNPRCETRRGGISTLPQSDWGWSIQRVPNG